MIFAKNQNHIPVFSVKVLRSHIRDYATAYKHYYQKDFINKKNEIRKRAFKVFETARNTNRTFTKVPIKIRQLDNSTRTTLTSQALANRRLNSINPPTAISPTPVTSDIASLMKELQEDQELRVHNRTETSAYKAKIADDFHYRKRQTYFRKH